MDIKPYWQNYINGTWLDAADGERITILDPATEEQIAEVAKAGKAEVEQAVEAAKACHQSRVLMDMRPIERGRMVMAMGQYLLDNLDEIARVLCYDSGKPLEQAIIEVQGSARYFEYYGSHADKMEGRSIPLGGSYYDFTVFEPYGVTAHVVPWNYPIEMAARSASAALATGNTVIVKSPELDPLSVYYLADAAEHVGLPKGALNIICGYGQEAGVELTNHPDVNMIVFTGSVETGQTIMSAAAKNVVPSVMELGGKSAALVFPDADLSNLAESTQWGIFMNSGQVCSAMSRMLVHSSVVDEVTDTLTNMRNSLTMGHGIDDHFISPIISQNQLDKVAAYCEVGKEDGAEAIFGGNIAEVDKGYFMEPTIFRNVAANARIAQEEIFGPVLSIIEYDDVDEAIAKANSTDFGLVAGVFTKDIDRAMYCAQRLEAGQVYINEWYAGGVETPFGGFRKSGFGREKGLEAMFNYVQTKNIAIKMQS